MSGTFDDQVATITQRGIEALIVELLQRIGFADSVIGGHIGLSVSIILFQRFEYMARELQRHYQELQNHQKETP